MLRWKLVLPCACSDSLVACLAGFGVQALTTGEGALGSLAKFANTFDSPLVDAVENAAEAVKEAL